MNHRPISPWRALSKHCGDEETPLRAKSPDQHAVPHAPDEDAVAAYEAEHGPIYDPHGDLIRVFLSNFTSKRRIEV
jgi:hypothetical protein